MPEPPNSFGTFSVHPGNGGSACAAVIIPSWNGRGLLSRCLPALAAQTRQDFEIIIVDNGSTDDTVTWVRETYPGIRLITLSENRGFAVACNAGICRTGIDLIITLNNDTIPRGDWLEELLSAADQHQDIEMFASTLWLDREPPVLDAAGFEVNRLGVAWNVARGAPVAELPSVPQEVFGPCAGAALYRRRLLQDVGLFDETYFAYLEDVELAWRARWAGWRCLSVPTSAVRHAHSATGGRDLPRKYWLLGRNRLWTILRHYPRPYLWRYLPSILLNEVLAGVLGAIFLRSLAPIGGRLEALRHSSAAAGAFTKAPCRLPASEAFAQLAPLKSPFDLLSTYAVASPVSRGSGTPDD